MPVYYAPNGPARGKEFIFYLALRDQANTKVFKTNPTLAAGDFKISKDGGSFNNLTTTPAVTPASGVAVKATISATETQCSNFAVVAQDASGAEWCDAAWNFQTGPGAIEGGAVDNATFTPTTSAFETDITEATADHYNGRIIVFTSGNLRGQACTITDYEQANSKGKFTVSTLTEAPANTDEFVIL